jgi:type VI protein secretion system component VasK
MGEAMDLNFWTTEWPLISSAPHLAIGGALAIALVVWALVSWNYRRQINALKAESAARGARLASARKKEAVVSQKRNELEATVQLLNNQMTTITAPDTIAATTQSVAQIARELASSNIELSTVLRQGIDDVEERRAKVTLTSGDNPPGPRL